MTLEICLAEMTVMVFLDLIAAEEFLLAVPLVAALMAFHLKI